MLQIQSLELKNFITYKHQIFDFDELFRKSDILLIYGKNYDDVSFANDNGAGKSIIYQAILFALTNRTTRNSQKDLLIGKFAKSMSCTLKLKDFNDTQFWIRRYRNHSIYGNGVKFKINGVEKGKGTPSELNTLILDTLGLSYRRIINTSIFESDDERSRFIYLGDKDGKSLLSQMKGFEIFQKCYEIAKAESESLEQKETQLKIEIEKRELVKQRVFRELSETKEQITLFEGQRVKQIKAEKQKTIEKQENLYSKIKERELVRTQNAKKLKAIKFDLLPQTTITLQKLENERKTKIDAINGLENLRAKANTRFSQSRKAYREAKNNEEGIGTTCQSCGNVITGKNLHEHIKKLEKEMARYMAKETIYVSQTIPHNEKRQWLTHEIERMISKQQDLVVEQKSIRTFIQYNAKLLEALERELREEISNSKEQIQKLKNVTTGFNGQLIRLHAEKVQLKKIIAQLNEELSSAHNRYRYKKAWLTGFGKEEIQTMALQTTVEDLNEDIKRISEILTDGHVDIQLLTEKTQGNKKVRNLFEFEIGDMNKKGLPFKEWSKGQKKRIEIIVSFALMGIEQNLISEVFLDELFDGVDEIGINKIKFLLEEESKTKGKRFIVFSHSRDVKNLFENKAYVQLKHGQSTLHLIGE
jgi:DNA repair exonuclease SbcCD ATPase subunit